MRPRKTPRPRSTDLATEFTEAQSKGTEVQARGAKKGGFREVTPVRVSNPLTPSSLTRDFNSLTATFCSLTATICSLTRTICSLTGAFCSRTDDICSLLGLSWLRTESSAGNRRLTRGDQGRNTKPAYWPLTVPDERSAPAFSPLSRSAPRVIRWEFSVLGQPPARNAARWPRAALAE